MSALPTILILNGPNLNLLGLREPHIYGHDTLADVGRDCAELGRTLGLHTDLRQTNAEHHLIDLIHEHRTSTAGLIINPGGLTHTSVALMDALGAYPPPIIEVHISNIHRRESFRHHSYVSLVADGVIAGCGTQGYRLALQRLAVLIA
ncbi:type II 3-dehydroquinate dehydratase [Deinococcus sp. QL22]|uniref:type II 3-dehydroquinate dehydratase n=1 Tax=Deinococcus sp. QL22 TaxID=2939437 RepID=UPI0020176E2F|nr:type II 3-dehydroquinate dehydratase [Deinococcus sp. QL22]UQN10281.1 type II 3-dehydroquinate dehydratase [Deinococcus sp. QL22]